MKMRFKLEVGISSPALISSLPQMWIHPNKDLNKQGHFIQNDVAVIIPVPFHSCSIFLYRVEWNGTMEYAHNSNMISKYKCQLKQHESQQNRPMSPRF